MGRLGSLALPLVAAVLTYAPNVARACAVCFDSEDDNRQAFVDTTIFLTILPLALFAIGIALVVHRVRKAERAEAERHRAFLAATEFMKHKDSQSS